MRSKLDYSTFWRETTRDGKAPCALAGADCYRCTGTGHDHRRNSICLRCGGEGRIACSSVMDAHHFVPKRLLRTDRAKLDVRNGTALCRDHHDLVEQGWMLSPRPPLLDFFIADHDVPARNVPEGLTERPVLKLVRR